MLCILWNIANYDTECHEEKTNPQNLIACRFRLCSVCYMCRQPITLLKSEEGAEKLLVFYGREEEGMLVDSPIFSMFGDIGGVKRNQDDTYTFDGAAGSAGISFKFPEDWESFDKVTFLIEAENLRPDDGAMALIVNDGYNTWRPPVAKGPYPWIKQGLNALAYPISVFTSGAASFQLNETFGHSTNWKMTIKSIEFLVVEKKIILMENPDFSVYGDTTNTVRNVDNSYTFIGDASALLCFHFPQGWNDFENVSFFIENVENHIDSMTMSLIVKNRYNSWADIDQAYGNHTRTLSLVATFLLIRPMFFTTGRVCNLTSMPTA